MTLGHESHTINVGAYAAVSVFKLRSSERALDIPLDKAWSLGLLLVSEGTFAEGTFANASYLLLYNSNLQLSSNFYRARKPNLRLN